MRALVSNSVLIRYAIYRLSDLVRVLGELVVEVCGDITYEGDGDADDGLRFERGKSTEELHWAVGVGGE